MTVSKYLGNKQNVKKHFHVYENVNVTKKVICLTSFQDLTKSTLCENLINNLTII